MKAKELNKILKDNDLGDDFFDEDNLLFDTDYTPVPTHDVSIAIKYASQKIDWYFTDFDKHYLRADCNRFHWMFAGYMQEWFVRNRSYPSPAIGMAYGKWEGQMHMWNYMVTEKGLIHINWTHIEKRPNYSGVGSISV